MRFNSLYAAIKNYCTAVVALVAIAACNDIDCPLYNTVQTHYGFYHSRTKEKLNLTDTLTIRATGTDSILYNRGIGINTFTLPMSYSAAADTLLWQWKNRSGAVWVDTLIVDKTNQLHSESIDCSTVVFHNITGVALRSDVMASSRSTRIDSVVIVKRQVTYDVTEHLQVYISQ